MKKQTGIILLLIIFLSTYTQAQTSFDVLYELRRKSLQYENGMNWGFGIGLAGIVLAPIGLTLTSTGFALGNLGIASTEQRAAITTSGYALTSIGIISLIVGFVVWRNQEKKYINIINRQYKYRDFLQEKGDLNEND